jgi:hypothetical protein
MQMLSGYPRWREKKRNASFPFPSPSPVCVVGLLTKRRHAHHGREVRTSSLGPEDEGSTQIMGALDGQAAVMRQGAHRCRGAHPAHRIFFPHFPPHGCAGLARHRGMLDSSGRAAPARQAAPRLAPCPHPSRMARGTSSARRPHHPSTDAGWQQWPEAAAITEDYHLQRRLDWFE